MASGSFEVTSQKSPPPPPCRKRWCQGDPSPRLYHFKGGFPWYGCGSKTGTRNGTLVTGNKDDLACSPIPGGFMLTHTRQKMRFPETHFFRHVFGPSLDQPACPHSMEQNRHSRRTERCISVWARVLCRRQEGLKRLSLGPQYHTLFRATPKQGARLK